MEKKKRDMPLTFFMWHIFEKYQLVWNVTSSGVPIKETNVRFISAKEGTVGSGYLLSRAFGSVRKAMQTFHSQLKSGTWINDKYHEQHTVWHSRVLDGTQQERTQCYLLWSKKVACMQENKMTIYLCALLWQSWVDSISFYRIKLLIVKEGAWQGLVEKIIQLGFSHQGL